MLPMRLWLRWLLLAYVCLALGSETGAKTQTAKPSGKTTLASLGPNFQWNCQTAGHAGNCAKLNRTVATYELIDELDIGVVTDFLPGDATKEILEKIKVLPDR